MRVPPHRPLHLRQLPHPDAGGAELLIEAGQVLRGAAQLHVAARIMALAGPGEVYASWATRELLSGSPIGFIDRGVHKLKGLAEPRRVYLVEPSA